MRRKFLIPLTFAAGVLALASLSGVKTYQRVSADPVITPNYGPYIPIKDGWIENTDGSAVTNLNDAVRARNDRFWNGNDDSNNFDSQERTFNAMDEFVDTIHRANGGEGWRGAYRTPELTLADNNHRYISFLFGGGEGDIFVNVWHVRHANGSEEFAEGYNRNVIEGVHTHFDGRGTFDDKEAKLNAPISCNMTFRYYRLPDSIEPGDQYLIYVRDGKTGGYGGFTFGDVHINQTLEDCAKSFSAHKAQMKINEFTSDWNRNANEFVLSFYDTNDYYADVRTAEAALTDADDGFEINNRLSKWAYDQPNSTAENGTDLISINYNGIYSNANCKDWRQKQPANNEGKYLNADTSGIAEGSKYRLVSNKFKLSGTGIVSIKMGGNSSRIELLNADTLATLDTINNPNFRDGDCNNVVANNVRQNTMTRLYIDWSNYLYSETSTYVRIAISDCRTGGNWGLAYFDELFTKYNEYPTFRVDSITQEGETDLGEGNWGDHSPYHGYITDTLIDNGVSSAFSDAYGFLQTYYSSLRSPSNRFDYSVASNATKVNVVVDYNTLSSEAKTLVRNSKDILYTESWDNNWFVNAVNTESTISSPLTTLVNDINAEVKSVSALKFNYSEAAGVFTYTDSAIRFGAFIKKDLFDNLGTVEGYGVVVALTSSLEGVSIKDKYLAKKAQFAADENPENDTVAAILDAICDGTNVKKASATGSSPVEADTQQKAFMGIDSSDIYYTWTVRKAVGGDEFNKSFTAVGYIVVDGNIVFLNEMTTSFKALAVSRLPSYDSHPAHDAIQYITEHFE